MAQYPTTIYLLKCNNKNSRKRCKICSKLIIKTTMTSEIFSEYLENLSYLEHLWTASSTTQSTAQKMKFSIKDFFRKLWPNPQEPSDLVTFTEEILN